MSGGTSDASNPGHHSFGKYETSPSLHERRLLDDSTTLSLLDSRKERL
jgi:hypothetical protein